MSKVKALLNKDIVFTKKWILFSIIYEVVIVGIILKENVTNSFYIYFFIPFIVASIPFTRLMSAEDNTDTRIFLKRFPVSKYKMVFARTLFLVLMLIISSASLWVIQVVVLKYTFSFELLKKLFVVLMLFMIYFLIQLGVFYKYSYFAAQLVLMVVFGIATAYGFIADNVDISFDYNSTGMNFFACILLSINIIIYFIDCHLYGENWGYKRRNTRLKICVDNIFF